MKKHSSILFASLLAFSSMSFAATWDSMTKAEVEKAFVNKTWTSIGLSRVNGQTMPGNTFTGSFDTQGHFYGKFSGPIKNGPQSDQGTYQIKNSGETCMKWQHWNDAKEFCTHIYQTKDAYIVVGIEDKLHVIVLKTDVTSGASTPTS